MDKINKPNDDLEVELDAIASSYHITDYSIELFHYTSLEALISIIENKRIWASNSFFLNDAKEIIHLKVFLHNGLLKIADQPEFKIENKTGFERLINKLYDWAIDYYKSRLYVLSLTDKEDSLPLWLNYGSNDGYRIKISLSDLLRLSSGKKKADARMINEGQIKEDTSINVRIFIGKVIYEDKRKEEILHKYLHLLSKELSILIKNGISEISKTERVSRIIFALANFAYIAKHSSFEPESEYRILYAGLDDKSSKLIRRFRKRSGIIVPYTEIQFENSNNESPIKEIKIGPKKNIELGKLGLKYFLQHKNLEHIEISCSILPLRD